VVFARSGQRLATASADGTVLVWDVPALLQAARREPQTLTAAQLETLWRTLGSEDADRAFLAILALKASPAQSVSLLKDRVKPVSAEILDRLLADLDDNAFVVREKANQELERLGKFIEQPLRKALQKQPGLEARRRIDRLLEKLQEEAPAPEVLRCLRSVEVLELIATAEAREALQTLAEGATDAELTREAKAALERLEKKR
jgi:hypothetical protein